MTLTVAAIAPRSAHGALPVHVNWNRGRSDEQTAEGMPAPLICWRKCLYSKMLAIPAVENKHRYSRSFERLTKRSPTSIFDATETPCAARRAPRGALTAA